MIIFSSYNTRSQQKWRNELKKLSDISFIKQSERPHVIHQTICQLYKHLAITHSEVPWRCTFTQVGLHINHTIDRYQIRAMNLSWRSIFVTDCGQRTHKLQSDAAALARIYASTFTRSITTLCQLILRPPHTCTNQLHQPSPLIHPPFPQSNPPSPLPP